MIEIEADLTNPKTKKFYGYFNCPDITHIPDEISRYCKQRISTVSGLVNESVIVCKITEPCNIGHSDLDFLGDQLSGHMGTGH